MGLKSVMTLSILSVLLSWTIQVYALPTGAPATACVSMYPQHPGPNGPVSAQTSLVVPFQITVTPAQAGTGNGYKITVVRNPNYPGAPPPLLGFFIQVRDPNNDTPLGEFVNLPNYARFGDCGPMNTVTHITNTPKPIDDGLSFLWIPTNVPASIRNVQVFGTFVQNMQTFWVRVPSPIFSINDESAQQTPVVAVPTLNTPETSFSTNNNFNVNNNVPATDMSLPTNTGNSAFDTTTNINDRRPGFGNNAAPVGPVINNNIPSQTHTPFNNADKFLPALLTIFAGFLLLL